ncbi:hypothetical protein WA026_008874, partial [Henosepilachna vigintioctopunctata]
KPLAASIKMLLMVSKALENPTIPPKSFQTFPSWKIIYYKNLATNFTRAQVTKVRISSTSYNCVCSE